MKKTLSTIGLFCLFFNVIGQTFPENLKEIGNWEIAERTQYFDATNLYDYINGASDFYLSYLFQDLWVVDYNLSNGKLVTLELYRHKDENCAFGIYAEERPKSVSPMKIGCEGYIDSGAAYFLKGSYYVKVFGGNDLTTNEDVKGFSIAASRLLEGNSELPDALTLLPDQDKVENSERFTAENFMGISGFNGIYSADYLIDDQEFKVFVFVPGYEESVKVVDTYIDNNKSTKVKNINGNIIKDEYNGNVLIIKENEQIKGIIGHPKPLKVMSILFK